MSKSINITLYENYIRIYLVEKGINNVKNICPHCYKIVFLKLIKHKAKDMKNLKKITFLFVVCFLVACQNKKQQKPNIIYILADDLGYGDLGCYGQKIIHTPHIDRMASEGMRFSQHYAGCTVSAPSRCSLLTGLHTGHSYIRGNKEILPEGQEPLPEG